MSSPQTDLTPRPTRADARRNYDKLVAAAREAFAEDGASVSLEAVARRAGVGSATLHRNFPSRQHLLEAVYAGEVEEMARVDGLEELEPWDALITWLRRFATFAATKRAIGDELAVYIERDDAVFKRCSAALTDAGEPLLRRAQEAGVVRGDVTFLDVGKMVVGIAAVRTADPEQHARILELALDGLRPRADS